MRTTLLLDHCPREPHGWSVRALLHIQGTAPADASRSPLNLSLVIDRSGSMQGAKLRAARAAAAHLVRRLRPEDRLSIVVYDDQVDTLVPTTQASNAQDILRAIRQIDAGGSTNLSGGWLRGRELVAETHDAHALNRVLMLTDGQANVGIQDPAQLAALTASARERGITTTTIGFGEDYDEHLLRAMSDEGGGQLYYIERPDQAPGVFAHEIDGLLDVCAQNVTVEFRPEPGVLITCRHSYPMVAGRANTFSLGDLYAAEPKPVLFEILLDHAPPLIDLQIATVVVSATVIENGQIEQRTISLPININLSQGAHTEPVIEREALLLEAARAREAAMEAQQQGDFNGARNTLLFTQRKLRQAGLDDADLIEEAQDLDSLAASMDPASFTAADSKYLYQRSQDAMRGVYSKKDLIARTPRTPRPRQP